MPESKQWRQEIELLQNYGKHKTFTFTTSSADAEDAVSLTGVSQQMHTLNLMTTQLQLLCLSLKTRGTLMREFGLIQRLVS